MPVVIPDALSTSILKPMSSIDQFIPSILIHLLAAVIRQPKFNERGTKLALVTHSIY